MHTLFALLTLALAGAAFAAEGLACLGAGDFRAELSQRFHSEHALFTESGFSRRQALGENLFIAALFVLLFGRIFLHASQLYTVTPPWVYGSMYLLYPVSYTLLLIKFFFCTRYNIRQMLVSLCLFLLFLVGLSRSYEQDLFAFMGFALSFKDLDWRRVIGWFAGITAAFTVILALLTFAGVLSYYYGPRLELGYENPNHFARVLFSCATVLVLLFPASSRRKKGFLLLGALFIFISIFPRSRSTCVALIFLLLALAVFPLFCRLLDLNAIRSLLTVSPVLLAAVSFAAAYFYDHQDPLMAKINNFSTWRLFYWHSAMTMHSPSLFGQELHYDKELLVALDNAFLQTFYTGGILIFIVTLIGLCLLIRRLLAERRYWLFTVVFSWIVYNMLEAFLFYPSSNFTLFLFAPLVFGTAFPADGTPEKAV